MYLPAYHFFTKRKDKQQNLKKDHERVISFLHRLGIPVIDIYEAFSLHPDPQSLFLFRRNNHYNNDGYSIVAETILKTFQKDGRSRILVGTCP